MLLYDGFLNANIMKLIRQFFIGIPNIPLILFISIYVLYNLWKHTGIVEMNMQSSFLTQEIKEHINIMFPKILFRINAFVFWTYVLFKAII